MIKKIFKRCLAAAIAFGSIASGVCWHLSAKYQVDALSADGQLAIDYTVISAALNQSAAGVAVFCGLCVALGKV